MEKSKTIRTDDKRASSPVYVYFASYQSIFLTLHLVDQNFHPIAIVKKANEVRLFLDLGIEIINIGIEPQLDFRSPIDLLRAQKYLKQFIINIRPNGDLYFGYNAYDTIGFYLAAHWTTTGKKVHFLDFDPPRQTIPFTFSKLFNSVYLKKTFHRRIIGVFFDIRAMKIVDEDNPSIGIDNDFLEFYRIHKLAPKSSLKVIREKVIRKHALDPGPQKNLFAADGLWGIVPFVDKLSFKELLSAIEDKVIAKLHPAETENTYYSRFTTLPKHIPIEFYIPRSKAILSISSVTLKEAAYFSHIKSISLLNLVKWTNSYEEDRYRQFLNLNQSKHKIFFPNSFSELFQLLQE